jgi:hypothetical protein
MRVTPRRTARETAVFDGRDANLPKNRHLAAVWHGMCRLVVSVAADGCGDPHSRLMPLEPPSMPRLAVQRLFATAALILVAAVASANTVYEVYTTGTDKGSKNNDVYIGQSFNSGTNTLLTSASLEINRNALAIANFTLNLHAATGSPNNYFKTGSSLADATFSNSILSDTQFTFYDFTNPNWAL